MSEHTSGSWRWLPQDHLVGDAGRTTIIKDGVGVYNATEGDKKLIASAPDLLAALESSLAAHYATWMAARAEVEGGRTSHALFEKEPEVIMARAAIAKATG